MKNGKINWKFLSLTILSTLVFITLAGCGSSDDETSKSSTETEYKDTLNIGVTNAPSGFNPINSADYVAQWINRMMYPTLLDQTEALEFEPNLAESFESTDNKVFTIKLKEAKWSDDEPITANDVAFTLNTIANPDVETALGTYIEKIEGVKSGKYESGSEISGVKVIDDLTLTITMKTVIDPNYLKETIGFYVPIIPKHIVEKESLKDLATSDFATKPTVSGSLYNFVKYETNGYIQLKANPNYYKGKPKIENVYVKILQGANVVTSLESGEIDMVAGGGIGVVPISELKTVEANDSLVIDKYPGAGEQFMSVNNTIFDNKEIRQALTYAIDREAIVKNLFYGEATVIPSTYTEASAYYLDSLEPLEYDPEKAKALIKESGWDTSKEITLTVPTGNKPREQSANLIQQNLEAVGLKVKQETFDFPTTFAKIKAGETELSLVGLNFTSDPDLSIYWSTYGTQISHIQDTYIDQLWQEGLEKTDEAERKPIYDEIQEYLVDEAFFVGLYSPDDIEVKSAKLNGGMKSFWWGSLYDMQDWTLEK
ncbi:MAG: ABC transporter substrate-binding protein [Streptococcaceae bacterium]|jgi:peptide/nickel transport system substrate-binding protein|nr:ABC transporter substrate-binding protein [Streptococcaceae bacterium]MCH4178023.1 ABC transporter substrate-binding protein [Streptococcaceae bacterium]